MMNIQLDVSILAQPDFTSCGPTCLHAIYAYYGHELTLQQLVAEVPTLKDGGTLGALLGCHALSLGFKVAMYTYDLKMFDPTWFLSDTVDIAEKLNAQLVIKKRKKLKAATSAFCKFLALGGQLRMEELKADLLRKYLKKGVPILAGLSATYLYQCVRECPDTADEDDVRGEPCGHFVVLSGYDSVTRLVTIADPYRPNPLSTSHRYQVHIDRVVCAILLGIVTYDANLVVIEQEHHRCTGRKKG